MQRLIQLAMLGLIFGGGGMFLLDKPPGANNAPASFPQRGYSQQGQRQPNNAPQQGQSQTIYTSQQRQSQQHQSRQGYASQPYQSAPGRSPSPQQPPAIYNSQPRAATPVAAPTIRIASYNVQVFGAKKEQNRPVMQTLAAVMRFFDIIAIQEIRIADDDYFLRRYLDKYLNPYSGRTYDYVLGPRLGRSNSKEQYAYIYDTARVEVNRNQVYTVRDPDDLLHRPPFVAMFRTRGPQPQEAFTFVLANLHTDPDETNPTKFQNELNGLAKVYHAVRAASGGEDDVILLGDFNANDRKLGDVGNIPGVRPLISGVYTNTRQTKLYDNILIHRQSTDEFTGQAGVYDIQRQHNLRLEDALQVSDHLPIWAEFSVKESAAPGRVAALPELRR